MTATFHVGDAITVMNTLPAKSVDLVLSSPPFLALRSYLPADHPDKQLEGGSQATPGAYIDWLIDVVEACARILAPHGSLCFELGDTYSGAGGENNLYTDGYSGFAYGLDVKKPAGQGIPRAQIGWPLAKSLSLIPELFRLTLVYGQNPLTGRQTERWRLRNVIRWVRPNPPVGALGDKFRPATSELMVFCKSAKRYFDLDAVREPVRHPDQRAVRGNGKSGTNNEEVSGRRLKTYDSTMSSGAPPLDWWNIPLSEGKESQLVGLLIGDDEFIPQELVEYPFAPPPGLQVRAVFVETEADVAQSPPVVASLFDDKSTLRFFAAPLDWWNIPPGGYEGAHYAVWPPELCVKPIKAMSPEAVCRTCGEPRRRIVGSSALMMFQPQIAAYLRERRHALGLSSKTVNDWFPKKSQWVGHWESPTSQPLIPTPEQWVVLKERLGLDDRFDDVIEPRNAVEYEDISDYPSGNTQNAKGEVYQRLPARKDRIAPDRFSDCGHDDYRPGLVLDPFAGSGTTLAVATGHGRDAIGIDLDERNYQLALERVGPLILQLGKVAA